jgi:hypothetical protein
MAALADQLTDRDGITRITVRELDEKTQLSQRGASGVTVAEALVAQFDRMVQRDGGSLRLLGTEGNIINVGYQLGADPECADGVCILPDAELQALMSETLHRRDPALEVVVSLIKEGEPNA